MITLDDQINLITEIHKATAESPNKAILAETLATLKELRSHYSKQDRTMVLRSMSVDNAILFERFKDFQNFINRPNHERTSNNVGQ